MTSNSQFDVSTLAQQPWHVAGITIIAIMAFTGLRLRRGWPFFVFFLWHYPSTCLHEIAHFIVGLTLGARPVNLDLMPEIEKEPGAGWSSVGSYRMGQVVCTRVTPLNALPIGLAPLLLMPAAFLVFKYWTNWIPVSGPNTLARYAICFIMLQGAIPSGTDFRVATNARTVIAYLLLAVALLIAAAYLHGVIW